ncbi:MAG: arsenite methyltransferase [candidate division NC10 bacterium]|nr:arsenite methyltransferase [candidate division NC10 bacterium]
MRRDDEIRAAVRARYARAGQEESGCCGPSSPSVTFRAAGYGAAELEGLPAEAVASAFGCGNPLAFADVQPGQVVLDIGSGAGIDCLLAAERAGPGGRVIGVDMTPEMLRRAEASARAAGCSNVEFRLGEAECLPVADTSVDWVISNCVLNLSPDKPAVFREIHRVLRPGGRLQVADVVAEDLPEPLREDLAAWSGCLAGALSEADYVAGLEAAGFAEVRVVARLPYEAKQIEALLGSPDRSGGCGGRHGVGAADLAGKVWSATFAARKPGGAAGVTIRSAEAADLPAILALLEEARLPTAGVAEHVAEFLVAEEAGGIAGAVGMERAGEFALFRSLVVRPDARRRGIAERLFRALEATARANGVRRAYLLTETLEARCRAWGFTRAPRETVPEALRASPELTGCCPSSVALMAKDL